MPAIFLSENRKEEDHLDEGA